jgi:hypothetical protein
MRYLLIVSGLLCLAVIGFATRSSQFTADSDYAYEAAYQKWVSAIDANPHLEGPFWFQTDSGPAEMRAATQALLAFGPNLTPFLVEKLRRENDPSRLYRLVLLLDWVAGINLYYGSGAENFYGAAPQFRDQFLKDWDSQKYTNATELLRSLYRNRKEDTSAGRIDPKALAEIRRFGVFAVPFIEENIRDRNSRELFAAFLIITGKSKLYADYIENPSNRFIDRGEKLNLVKSWARDSEKRVDKLQGLHERVKQLAIDP